MMKKSFAMVRFNEFLFLAMTQNYWKQLWLSTE